VRLEYTCIYTRNYNLMLKMKERGEWKDGDIERLEGQVRTEISDKTYQLVEKYNDDHKSEQSNLTVALFQKWVTHYKADKEVGTLAEAIEQMHTDVFVNQKIESLDFQNELPTKMTKEMYI